MADSRSHNPSRPTGFPGTLDSEDRFLACIDRHFPKAHTRAPLGRGDDCAVLVCPEKILCSTDLFLEHAHFRRDYFLAADIGYKALAVNLSDLAAMGARPLGFSLGLMAPAELDAEFWDELFSAMAALAEKWDAPLTGGDLSRGERLGLCITIWGAMEPGQAPLTRGGAEPGMELFVLGREPRKGLGRLDLGLARVGLLSLEACGRDAAKDFPEAVAAHLRPAVLIKEGRILAASGLAVSLMDLSDGLARDLPRLLGPRLGAELALAATDLHPELAAFAATRPGLDPLETAVLGGEDYALLGAAWPRDLDALARRLPGLRRIGRVGTEPGIRLNNRPFTAAGFDHFSR